MKKKVYLENSKLFYLFVVLQVKKIYNLINVIKIYNIDYISLTDLARYKNADKLGDVIIKWMSNKSSFDFEKLNGFSERNLKRIL
jgi:hypothetical protein